MSKTGPRFVLASRRLSNPERHALYKGAEFRNQIILLEPRDDQANHLTNPDLLSAAKRYAAAVNLAATHARLNAGTATKKFPLASVNFFSIHCGKGGLVYVRVEQWDETPDGSVFEIEPLGASRRPAKK